MDELLPTGPAWLGWIGVGYAAFLIAIAIYDVRRRRVPNVAIYPAIAAATGLAFVRGDGEWWSFVLAGLGAGVFFAALAWIHPGSMGGGDIKLAALVGLMAGWPDVVVAIFVAFAVGATVGVILVGLGRLGRRDPLPFAPALAVGALTAAVAGHQVVATLWPGLTT
ncbi:MAG TPA: A24 family peptidase [Candidatus Limnocylindrales bacterium]